MVIRLAFPRRLYQFALWMAGGVPQEHRTDSLSAAFNNLAEREELAVQRQTFAQRSTLKAIRRGGPSPLKWQVRLVLKL